MGILTVAVSWALVLTEIGTILGLIATDVTNL